MAVVLTESVQTIVLLIGACCITFMGYQAVGGWEALQGTIAEIAAESPEAAEKVGNHLSVWRPHGDASDLPWYSVLLGYPVLGLWYWCADQTIVQRVLGAKDENHARVGPLFAGFIKILPVFIFVLPGVMCLALIHQGKLAALPPGADGTPDSKHTLAALITGLLPPGLKGIMAAALLAALMSTVSGALNSIATLFSYDLFKRWRPETPDRKLITIGRVVTFCAMLAAVGWSLQVKHFTSIFEGNQKMIGYICPPVTALFIWGVFLRRLNATAAIVTAWFGTILGLLVFFLDWNGYLADGAAYFGFTVPFLMIAVYLFAACSMILMAVSWSKRTMTLLAALGTITATPAAIVLYFACMHGWMGLSERVPEDFPSWMGCVIVPGFFFARRFTTPSGTPQTHSPPARLPRGGRPRLEESTRSASRPCLAGNWRLPHPHRRTGRGNDLAVLGLLLNLFLREILRNSHFANLPAERLVDPNHHLDSSQGS